MKLIIKHGRKLSAETINQALSMHQLIATNEAKQNKTNLGFCLTRRHGLVKQIVYEMR